MRIGIDARLYGPTCGTGIGRYTTELLRALGKLPYEPDGTFVVFLRKDGFDVFDPPNTGWTKVLADVRPYSLAAQTQFVNIIRDAQVDLLHYTHFDHPLAVPIPFVITIHDLILLHHPTTRASTLGPLRFWMKYLAYRRVLQHAAANALRILTPSRAVKEDIVRELAVMPEKIIPTPLGIDHIRPRMANVSPSHIGHRTLAIGNHPYLLYIGNAYPHKNLEQLIRIVPEIARRHQNLRIVLVGRADDFSKRLQASLSQRTPIVFSGSATDAGLGDLLTHATAYVNVSAMEGFDLPCLEAAARGIPVIASDIPVHRETLGDAAQFVPFNDDRQLLDAIHRVTVDNAHRAILIARGRERAQRYTWQSCAAQTMRAYREAVAWITT